MSDPTWTDPDIPDKGLRDKLRTYALEEIVVGVQGRGSQDLVSRGEIGAKAFVALQNVLDVLADYAHIGGARVSAEAVREAIRKGLS